MFNSKQYMKIVVTADYFFPGSKAGGPIKSVMYICEELAKTNDVVIFTRSHDYMCKENYSSILIDNMNKSQFGKIYYVHNKLKFIKNFFQTIQDADYIYFNSLYSFQYTLLPLIINFCTFKKRVILSPRGELLEGAMKIKYLRKMGYLYFFQSLFKRNVEFLASSHDESCSIKTYLNKSSFILSNPIKLRQPIKINTKKIPNYLDLIMICRISEIKNIELVIDALSGLSLDVKIRLQIYGVVHSSTYFKKLQLRVSAICNRNISIEFMGHADSDTLKSKILSSHCLINSSYSENFGHSIIESLSFGRPVICSDQTPWKLINDNGAGYCIPLNIQQYRESILKLCAMDQTEWEEACKNAYSFYRELQSNSIKNLHVSPLFNSI